MIFLPLWSLLPLLVTSLSGPLRPISNVASSMKSFLIVPVGVNLMQQVSPPSFTSQNCVFSSSRLLAGRPCGPRCI